MHRQAGCSLERGLGTLCGANTPVRSQGVDIAYEEGLRPWPRGPPAWPCCICLGGWERLSQRGGQCLYFWSLESE